MIGAIKHTDACGIRFDDSCGFGCHGTDQANLLGRLAKSAKKRRQWISVWLDSPCAFVRHRFTMAAIRRRKAGWSIIDVDNLNRDYQTEYFVEGGFPTEAEAQARCKEIVATKMVKEGSHFPYYDEHGDRWLTVVPGTRKLYVFEGY